MNCEKLLRMSNEEITKLTKAEILEALKTKYSVTSALDEKEKEKENHDREMKEFRCLVESLASCLSLELPRDYWGKKVEWNAVSIPLVMGKVFAEIAKIEYTKEINKKKED